MSNSGNRDSAEFLLQCCNKTTERPSRSHSLALLPKTTAASYCEAALGPCGLDCVTRPQGFNRVASATHMNARGKKRPVLRCCSSTDGLTAWIFLALAAVLVLLFLLRLFFLFVLLLLLLLVVAPFDCVGSSDGRLDPS